SRDFFNHVISADMTSKLTRNHWRTFLQLFGQTETSKCKVTHLKLRWFYDGAIGLIQWKLSSKGLSCSYDAICNFKNKVIVSFHEKLLFFSTVEEGSHSGRLVIVFFGAKNLPFM